MWFVFNVFQNGFPSGEIIFSQCSQFKFEIVKNIEKFSVYHSIFIPK